jgi:hypothetical protein
MLGSWEARRPESQKAENLKSKNLGHRFTQIYTDQKIKFVTKARKKGNRKNLLIYFVNYLFGAFEISCFRD